MRKTILSVLVILVLMLVLQRCKKDPIIITEQNCPTCIDSTKLLFDKSPYPLVIPTGLGAMPVPQGNPITRAKVNLGRKLFYDPILSGDSTQSCASCHKQEFSFADGLDFSEGIDGEFGDRNAMAIINLGWSRNFFWDGRAPQLEDQALGPVTNPIEMHALWPNVTKKLMAQPQYVYDLYAAFGTLDIDSNHVAKALASFMRIIISGNSLYDKVRIMGTPDAPNLELLNASERDGYDIFTTERGDCFHCHGTGFYTDHLFHNNALDSDANISDQGLYITTNNINDIGKFKAPTLRNIVKTAPYMHDSRFKTLEEVIVHYSFGLENSATVDPLMKQVVSGGIQLNTTERQNLLAFLKTFTDEDFLTNPEYSNPFEN